MEDMPYTAGFKQQMVCRKADTSRACGTVRQGRTLTVCANMVGRNTEGRRALARAAVKVHTDSV